MPSEKAYNLDHVSASALIEHRGEPTVQDVSLGEWLGMRRPTNIRTLIEANREELESYGPLHAARAMVELGSGAEREVTVYYLTEEQALVICQLSRAKRAKDVRRVLIKTFMNWRRARAEMSAPEWLEAREGGKVIRISSTDMIARFIEYAVSQGSRSADRYYENLTQMEYRCLGLLELGMKAKGMRDRLNARGLSAVATADQIVEKALEDGMNAKMYYKDIFQMAKRSVEAMALSIHAGPALMPAAFRPTHAIGGRA